MVVLRLALLCSLLAGPALACPRTICAGPDLPVRLPRDPFQLTRPTPLAPPAEPIAVAPSLAVLAPPARLVDGPPSQPVRATPALPVAVSPAQPVLAPPAQLVAVSPAQPVLAPPAPLVLAANAPPRSTFGGIVPPIPDVPPPALQRPMTSVAAPAAADAIDEAILDEDDVIDVPTLADIEDVNDVDRFIDDTDGVPVAATWRLAVRDALQFRFWPVDLDQTNAQHRRAMDLIERGIIPLKGEAFVPEARVTRAQLIDWLAQVEDWVRVGQTGLSLDTRINVTKRSSPIVTLLRLGLVTPQRPLDGEAWVDRAFELRVLDGLERAWSLDLLSGRPRLTSGSRPTRLDIAVWLREIAEELCHAGHAPVGKIDAKSLAHLTIVLTLLEDSSVTVREMAHHALADADPAIIATLLAGRKADWFRDPVALETLPELAVKLAQAPGSAAAGQFAECMRILRGLKDEALETRFVRSAQDALRRTPLHQPLPPILMSEIVSILAERGWTDQLDTLLLWGLPALEALVPYLENQSLDRHWSERMPYSIEPGWDSRGQGVVTQLRTLVKNPRIPAATRASALDRLDRLGESLPRDQMRALGLTPDNDADAARARLSRVALRIMDKSPAPSPSRARPFQDEAEIRRLVQMVRTYQLYLAIALGLIALITLAHIFVLLPLMLLRICRKLRQTLGVPSSEKGCGG